MARSGSNTAGQESNQSHFCREGRLTIQSAHHLLMSAVSSTSTKAWRQTPELSFCGEYLLERIVELDAARNFADELALKLHPRMHFDRMGLDALSLFAGLLYLRRLTTPGLDAGSGAQAAEDPLQWDPAWAELGDRLQAGGASQLEPALSAALEGVPAEETAGDLIYRARRVLQATVVAYGEFTAIRDIVARAAAAVPLASAADLAAARGILDAVVDGFMRRRAPSWFHSPPLLNEVLIEVSEPTGEGRVYDPCFGGGGLLAAYAGTVAGERTSSHGSLPILHGLEIEPRAYCVGVARIAMLTGVPCNLELGSAFESRPVGTLYDRILAVPPWGLPAPAAQLFPLASTGSEGLFIQHILQRLAPGGRAVIAVPETYLHNAGEQPLRQQLAAQFRLEAVIRLPADTALSLSSLCATLIVVSNQEPAERIRFLRVNSLETGLTGAAVRLARPLSIVPEPTNAEHRHAIEGWEKTVQRLAERQWDLTPQPWLQDELEERLADLREVAPDLPFVPLSEVVEVRLGLLCPGLGRETAADADGVHNIGIIRAADVASYERDSSFPEITIERQALPENLQNHMLYEGDLLMVRQGPERGWSEVYEGDGHSCVASKDLLVLHPRQDVSPRYLWCMLNSVAYRHWLENRCETASDGRLRTSDLEALSIPLLHQELQETITDNVWEGADEDSITALKRLIRSCPEYPVREWLLSSPQLRPFLDEATDAPSSDRGELAERAVSALLNQPLLIDADRAKNPSPMVCQLQTLRGALSGLRHVGQLPAGSVLFSALQRAVEALESRESVPIAPLGHWRPDSPALAERVAESLKRLIGDWRRELLDATRIFFRVEPAEIEMGQCPDVTLWVLNASSLPLCRFEVGMEPDYGYQEPTYLPERGELAVTLGTGLPAEPGYIEFTAVWRGERLDGSIIDGREDLSILVGPATDDDTPKDFGYSPYIVGNPVDRPEMLFGRDRIIADVQRQLSPQGPANVILLEGNRRTGKTSILRRLGCPEVLPNWVTVECSFQSAEGAEGHAGIATAEIFRVMAWDISRRLLNLNLPVPLSETAGLDPSRPLPSQLPGALRRMFADGHPFETFRIYLERVLETIRPRRLLLMLDEFDKLQEGIDSGATSPQVPENLRYLLQRYSEFSAVLTGSHRLKRLREEYWSVLFGIGYRIAVSTLDRDSARQLVTEPVQDRLQYTRDAAELAVELCDCHPFLLQNLANAVFAHAANTERRLIAVDTVIEVAGRMAEDLEHFSNLWSYAGSEVARIILTLCDQLATGPDPVTSEVIGAKLEQHGFPTPSRLNLGDYLTHLRELEVLTMQDSRYRLRIPLMRHWISHNVDFYQLRDRAIMEVKGQTR